MTPTLRPRPQRATLTISLLALLAFAAPAGAADVWNESVNGDFSGNGLAPSLVSLAAGPNVIRGGTGRAVAGGPVDLDYFSFNVPAGHVLDALEVLAGTASVGDGSFIGFTSGTTMTVSPTGGTAAGLMGWTLFNENTVGLDLLPYMAPPSLGSTGFTPPLASGDYTFWLQETGVGNATYAFSFSVTAVPEPAAALLMLGGLGLLAGAVKRR